MNSQYEGAKIIVNRWLSLKPKERVVILADELHVDEVMQIKKAAEETLAEVVVLIISSLSPQKGEPCHMVTYAMLNSDVIIAATHYSITTTQLKAKAIENGARFLSLPLASNNGISLLQCEFLQTDLNELIELSFNLSNVLHRGKIVNITTSLGTDVTFNIDGRGCQLFSGLCDKSGMSASASFELYIPPIETFTKGIVIVDASMGYLGKVKEPFEIRFNNGHIIYIQDSKEGNRLKQYIESFDDKRMYTACELGIGLNQNANCLGNSYIEDESSYKTFHIGFGRNTSLGGNHIAKGHFDIVINLPTITVDGVVVMKDGIIIV